MYMYMYVCMYVYTVVLSMHVVSQVHMTTPHYYLDLYLRCRVLSVGGGAVSPLDFCLW